MASDLRYMKLGRGPGSVWFFVYNVPRDLYGHPRFISSRGKPMTKITESLGTEDPVRARDVRDQRVIYWNRQFRMLRRWPTHREFRATAYTAELDSEIELHAAKEIADYCNRAGVELAPKTEHYRKIGIEFLKAKIAAGDWTIRLPLPDGRIIS